jgi:hypothetical protein
MPNEFFEMAQSAGSDFMAGAEQGQNLQIRAVDLARKRQELDAQKMEISNVKFQKMLTNSQAVLSAKPGSAMRKIHKEHAMNEARELGIPVHPSYFEMLDDEQLQIPLTETIANVLDITDPNLIDMVGKNSQPFFTNPAKGITDLFTLNSNIKLQKEKNLADNRGQKDTAMKDVRTLISEWKGSDTYKRTGVLNEAYEKMVVAKQGPSKEQQSVMRDILIAGDPNKKIDLKRISENGFNDLALIYSYIKMLDPNSSVKDAEIDITVKRDSWMNQVIGLWDTAKHGTALTPEARQKIINAADGLIKAQRTAQSKNNFSVIATGMATGLPPANIADAMGMTFTANMSAQDSQVWEKMRRTGLSEVEVRKNIVKQTAEQNRIKQQATKNKTPITNKEASLEAESEIEAETEGADGTTE